MTQPLATLHLELDAPPDGSVDARDIRTSLSAVIQVGNHLWLGCDETATLERLTDLGGGRWGDHRTFPLVDVLDLAGDEDDEVDVEGLAWDPPYLWIAGSHGRKRGKPDPDADVETFAETLGDVDREENRYLLARIPLEDDPEHGGLTPRRSCPDPRDPSVTLTAARLKGRGSDNVLMRALRKDPMLRKFLKLPGKDNGLDVEGLSAVGGRLFLGLRGPVLRGWAVVLELLPEQKKKKPERLKLARIGPDGRRYRRHYLDLDGLGVRELTHVGDEMLVLAGPTMDVHAPAAVFLWRGSMAAEDDSVAAGPALRRVMELPHDVDGPGDHPEGMCGFHADGLDGRGLLVVYDSPSRHRQARGGLRADVFPFPRPGWPEDGAGRPSREEAEGVPHPRGTGLLGTVVSALADAMAGGAGRPPSQAGPGARDDGPPAAEAPPRDDDHRLRDDAPADREDDSVDGERRGAPGGDEARPADEGPHNREEGQG